VYVNKNGQVAIENRVLAASEESLMSASDRLERFGRTVDIETIDIKKAAYDPQKGWQILPNTAIIQVRGHTWRRWHGGSNIDQITETDNVAGLDRLTNFGLSPSLLILPAGWTNDDLVKANPELQILGFGKEAHKNSSSLFSHRLPHAAKEAQTLLTALRQTRKGTYPSLASQI
jgi:hypothetical protein